jgi:hypothetical protein
VDLLWISVDGNYVIGLARFSEAGLRSNEVLFFGFFPFAIIFFGGGVDLESVEWIFESSRRHGLAQRGGWFRYASYLGARSVRHHA